MRLIISQGGVVRGGTIEIKLNDISEVYDAEISVDVELGKKVFGKWIPLPGYSKTLTTRIPKRFLSESWLAAQDNFEVEGVEFVRVNAGLFAFRHPEFSGEVALFMDGYDPVEFERVSVRWGEFNLNAVRSN